MADCTDVWRDTYGNEPPPMAAYDNGQGGVVVVLEGTPVPDSYVALEPGVHQDPTLIELEAALGDSGQGLTSNCFDEAGARDVVQGELDRLGLTGWAITVDESRPPAGSCSCAYFVVRPEEGEVQLTTPTTGSPVCWDHGLDGPWSQPLVVSRPGPHRSGAGRLRQR